MARYRDAVCKLCRREGVKLFLKGDRCFTEKCGVERRAYAPGEHGQGRRSKLSEYGSQLREKQKLRRVYGVLEQQFRAYFDRATRSEGITGEVLLQQLVRHGHIRVNGRKVNIPSYRLRPGDVVSIKEKSHQLPVVQEALKGAELRPKVSYLDVDRGKVEGTFLQIPGRADIPTPIEEQLIVELYSK
jgi:small subunit ribosomal protein S4